jgi:hypothetical protein
MIEGEIPRLIDEATKNLKKFEKTVDTKNIGKLGYLAIIVVLGDKAFTTSEGIHVIPIYSLKP